MFQLYIISKKSYQSGYGHDCYMKSLFPLTITTMLFNDIIKWKMKYNRQKGVVDAYIKLIQRSTNFTVQSITVEYKELL